MTSPVHSLEHLATLRAAEIAKITSCFRPGARVLEVGAGTGQQAKAIAARGFEVAAIEIPASGYRELREFPITDYDGRHIPFPDASFDIVFSSSVLEHVADLAQLNREIRRVLRPDGYCVHVMPTHAWRFWTTVSELPAALQYAWARRHELLPGRRPHRGSLLAWLAVARRLAHAVIQRRHGERGNVISETWFFHPRWWRRQFERHGFIVVRDEPMGLFYTGNMAFGDRWSLEKRERLAKILGSACHVFELRPRGDP